MAVYTFLNHAEFLDRQAELDRLDRWWANESDPFPLLVFGRRRTGKSWLLREFAHGKEADILVCDSRAERDQLASFARVLERSLGVRPETPDIRSFFDLILRPRGTGRQLVVIDEFPLLLEASRGADSALAAALEDRQPGVKLVLCGSQISTMTTLLAERAPLRGRATPLPIAPLRFDQTRAFLPELRADDLVTRYAIAGGMPLYLRRLGRRGSLKTVLCDEVFDPLGPLFDEGRDVLTLELTGTAIHFSLLAALSAAPSLEWMDLVERSHVEASTASRYIRILEDLQFVRTANPVFAPVGARRRRYRIADPFIRFWFRFVFPYQADLAAGLPPEVHYERNVAPFLADHVAPAFEDVCRAWVRTQYAATTDTVGAWWGLARHDLRRRKVRSNEEIDVVGARGDVVTVVGECRWQSRPMGRDVLRDLVEYKLPALGQTGVDVSGAAIVLFSRAGFRKELVAEAARRGDVRLVDLATLLEEGATVLAAEGE
ncbi:MAG TPA: ATP-binding protein [Candidatus Binatia bacterium]|nr:ATP-binding protein [Candidatus Binatia bacterium]